MRAFLISLPLLACCALAQQVLDFSNATEYPLAQEGLSPSIWVAENDSKAVQRTADDLAADFGRVTGANGTVTVVGSEPPTDGGESVIIVGAIGQSSLIDSLVSSGKIDVSAVEGQWEAYTTLLVQTPFEGVPWALVIAGSDRRGTIYGIYDISETMGVSPWYWWADVPPKTKTSIGVIPDAQKIQGSPSVKYRGFFINDESPALSGWTSENFPESEHGGNFVGEFYKLVFELMLRLKGNYLWPAMWGKMFYVDDENNGQLAEDFGVIMGTSHHEPMARSEKEQQQYCEGNWDWGENKDNIVNFFREGIERSSNWDTMYTMGMRGAGDAESPTLTPEALEEIVRVQQDLLKEVLDPSDLLEVPQAWVLYKEVGKYYQAGIEVPDEVVLFWTDDNAGNLQRVPLANETERATGHGIYYHFDYVGGPRNYKWINTISLVKTWEQMHLAYERQTRQIWIANVGDIKPLEVPLNHFMDMAYDMSKFQSPNATTEWITRWATREFGSSTAAEVANILNKYGILLFRRKYEYMNMDPHPYSVEAYDQADNALGEWNDLLESAQGVYDSLDEATKIAFFQLLLHPIMAGKTVVDMYIKADLNHRYANQQRISTNSLADEVRALFDQDADITNQYNSLNGGKWNHFVDQVHIGYTSWQEPSSNSMPEVTERDEGDVPGSGIMGVAIQGSDETAPDAELVMLSVHPYMPPSETRYLDVFARGRGEFSYEIKASEAFVTLSNANGTVTAPGNESDIRCVITVDWDSAPEGETTVDLEVSPSDGQATTVQLPVNKRSVPSEFSGFVESNGVVAIEAEHYSDAGTNGNVSYISIPHYGRTLSGVKLWPPTAESQEASSGPKLTYSFHTFSSADSAQVIFYFGPSLHHDPSRPLKFAYALDDGEAESITPFEEAPMGSLPPGWDNAVITGGWTVTADVNVSEGSHILSLWLLEPGLIVQKIAIDAGGFKETPLGPPESFKVGA
ncbi:hypothetical protein FQN50_008845 [Emmonsiellopsis sp. PD_5]|nr:hypothetical protein FQN50_008845 [Emmonsiellopsis sp. PD_5]